jgi:Tfp pilus assembly protein PilO
MNLSPQKRNKLIQLGVVTLAMVIAMWFTLIGPAQRQFAQKEKIKNDLTQKLAAKKQIIERGERIKTDLQKASSELRVIEDEMVTGDPFLWIIKTTHAFEIPNKIDIAKADPPQSVDSNLSKKAPYKALSFAFTGTANYHDLGTFLARFENAYPYVRILRLDVEPAGPPAYYEEKLSFLVEVCVLVKPANSISTKIAPRS